MKRYRSRGQAVNPCPLDQPTKWWFVFRDEATPRWWHIFTRHRPGFSHVFCLAEIAPNVLLIVNPQPHRVEMLSVSIWSYHLIRQYLNGGCRVVVANIETPKHTLVRRGYATTCASHVAYTVGLPFRGTTPYQLYRKLMQNGGEELCQA